MTVRKRFKRRVREQAAATGASYQATLRAITEEKDMDIRCSFCGKSHENVQKLIAGPGVYICDECVSLCDEIIAQDPAPDPGALAKFVNRSGEEILQLAPAWDRTIQRIESDLQAMVVRARSLNVSWEDIAAALGTTPDAAESRFGAART